ncbi:hypothetical protein Tcan_11902 [Toxocara canis]|uniref:Uncharacterized protein n=1 Tax=Toxocara canis TaxID=6265 RepID=A0A0B2VCR7_TOXCA|nr:hypothetical protein Tcan_11902 [Toxocara canis]
MIIRLFGIVRMRLRHLLILLQFQLSSLLVSLESLEDCAPAIVRNECNPSHKFAGELVFYVRKHDEAIEPYDVYNFKYVIRSAKRYDRDGVSSSSLSREFCDFMRKKFHTSEHFLTVHLLPRFGSQHTTALSFRNFSNDVKFSENFIEDESVCTFQTMHFSALYNLGRMEEGKTIGLELESGEDCYFTYGKHTATSSNSTENVTLQMLVNGHQYAIEHHINETNKYHSFELPDEWCYRSQWKNFAPMFFIILEKNTPLLQSSDSSSTNGISSLPSVINIFFKRKTFSFYRNPNMTDDVPWFNDDSDDTNANETTSKLVLMLGDKSGPVQYCPRPTLILQLHNCALHDPEVEVWIRMDVGHKKTDWFPLTDNADEDETLFEMGSKSVFLLPREWCEYNRLRKKHPIFEFKFNCPYDNCRWYPESFKFLFSQEVFEIRQPRQSSYVNIMTDPESAPHIKQPACQFFQKVAFSGIYAINPRKGTFEFCDATKLCFLKVEFAKCAAVPTGKIAIAAVCRQWEELFTQQKVQYVDLKPNQYTYEIPVSQDDCETVKFCGDHTSEDMLLYEGNDTLIVERVETRYENFEFHYEQSKANKQIINDEDKCGQRTRIIGNYNHTLREYMAWWSGYVQIERSLCDLSDAVFTIKFFDARKPNDSALCEVVFREFWSKFEPIRCPNVRALAHENPQNFDWKRNFADVTIKITPQSRKKLVTSLNGVEAHFAPKLFLSKIQITFENDDRSLTLLPRDTKCDETSNEGYASDEESTLYYIRNGLRSGSQSDFMEAGTKTSSDDTFFKQLESLQ